MGGQRARAIPNSANCSRARILLASDWYAARLAAKQKIDRQLWRRHVEYLDRFLKRASHADEAARLGIADRCPAEDLERSNRYGTLRGTGRNPLRLKIEFARTYSWKTDSSSARLGVRNRIEVVSCPR